MLKRKLGVATVLCFLSLLLAPSFASSMAHQMVYNWSNPETISITNLDSLTTVNDHSIVVGSDGIIHLVYYGYCDNLGGSQEIYYLNKTLGGWGWENISKVNQTNKNQWRPVLALDSNGACHVVWTGYSPNSTYQDLFYSTNEGGGWSAPYNITQTPANNEFHAGMTIDSAGGVHIAYYDLTNRTLMYINRSIYGVFSPPINITGPEYRFENSEGLSIDLDSHSNIYIAYGAYSGSYFSSELYIVNNSAGFWSQPYNISQDWSTTDHCDLYPSMSIDNNDSIHIAWLFRNNYTKDWGIKYINYTLGVWGDQKYFSVNGETVQYVSLVTDDNNKVHIVFSQNNDIFYPPGWPESEIPPPNEIYYISNLLGGFSIPVSIISPGCRPCLVLDQEGYAHIIYYVEEVYSFVNYIRSMEPVTQVQSPIQIILTISLIVLVAGALALAVYLVKIRPSRQSLSLN